MTTRRVYPFLKAIPLASIALLAPHDAPAEQKPGAPPVCFEVLSDRELAPDFEWVYDVRWAGDDRVFVGEWDGVFEIPLTGSPDSSRRVVARGMSLDELRFIGDLAVSGDLLAVGGFVYSYGWTRRSHQGLLGQYALEANVDLDLFGDRILILGVKRDEQRSYSPDGAIGWIGPLLEGSDGLAAVYYSSSGPGVRNFRNCDVMRMSVVRFLADGAFIIVPGFEEGVFLYTPERRLLRTWTSAEVGFDAGCDLTPEEEERFPGDPAGRIAWANQRRTVDDVLPLPEGPGLIVRSAGRDGTRWQLKTLHPDGSVSSCGIPVTSSSRLAHLKGDLRGDEVVFLVAIFGHTPQNRHPETRPRIMTLKYKP